MRKSKLPTISAIDNIEAESIDFEYDSFIKKLIADNSSMTVPNSSHSHALSIFRAVFENAKESVFIYSDKLHRKVYNDILLNSLLLKFIENKGNVKVLVREDIDGGEKNNFAISLKNKKVEIKKITKDNFLLQDGKFDNFFVADGKMFRLEVNAEYAKAYCNFNNPTMSEKLAKIFEHSYQSNVTRII